MLHLDKTLLVTWVSVVIHLNYIREKNAQSVGEMRFAAWESSENMDLLFPFAHLTQGVGGELEILVTELHLGFHPLGR